MHQPPQRCRRCLLALLQQPLALLLLAGAAIAGCTAQPAMAPIVQQVARAAGAIDGPGPVLHNVPIGAARKVIVTVESDQQGLRVTATPPQGGPARTLTTSAAPSGNIPAPGQVFADRAELSSPADGSWSFQIEGRAGSRYILTVEVETTTVLEVQVDRQRYTTGQPIGVTARLYQEQTLLTGVTARGELYSDEALLQAVELKPGPDGALTARLDPAPAGALSLRVTATQGLIQRQVAQAIRVTEASARIVRVQGERLVDASGNGSAEELVLDVQIEIKRSGPYTLAGHLESPDGRQVAYAEYNSAIQAALDQGEATLPAGIHTLQLSYGGQQIRASDISGPYVARIILYDTSQQGAEVDALVPNYQTKPYQIADFE